MTHPYSTKNRQRIDPTFQIRMEVILARAERLSVQEATFALESFLKEPTCSLCSIDGCTQEHQAQMRLDQNGNKYGWSICPMQDLCSDEEAALLPDGAVLQTIAITSPTFAGIRSSTPRPFRWNSDDHNPYFSPEFQITYVLSRLRDINGDDILAVYINSACSLTVKIGTKASRHFTMRTIKNLLKYSLIFEHQLDSVHSSSRIRQGPMYVEAWYRAINAADSWRELMQLAEQIPTIGATDVTTLKGTGVVQFGQHAASLYAGEVLAWIDVVVKMVMWCDGTSCNGTKRYSMNRWGDLHVYFLDLLEDMERYDLGVEMCGPRGQRFEEGGVVSATYRHHSDVLDGSHAQSRYQDDMARAERHPLKDLLQYVAMERCLESSPLAIGIATRRKLLDGDYGWLPEGAPGAKLDALPWLMVKDERPWFCCVRESRGCEKEARAMFW